MKHINFFISMVVFLAVNVVAIAQGQAAERGDFHLSVYAAGAFPEDEELDTELFLSGRFTYDVLKYLELGIESGWLSYDITADGIDFGDTNGVPLLAVGLLKFPIGEKERFVPYLTGGVGVAFWSFDESNVLSDASVDITSDTSFAAKAGAGFDVKLTDHVAFFVEANYLWSDYEAPLTAPSVSISDEAEMNALFAGGGLKVNF